ncbi:ABC transporter ATP-binding protein [Brevundimonas vesicularis]
MTSLLELDGVEARLGGKPVLTGMSLRVQPGELVALCGPNGAGKSSALKAGLGLLPATAGRALLQGQDVRGLSERQRGQRVAYLPQERHIAWNLPAIEVAALGAPFLQADKALALSLEALKEVGAAHLAERGVADMSGGERARVLLARALVVDAPLLLADEPVAGLDPDAQLLVLERLRARACGDRAVLVSLHDLSLAAQFADRVIVLEAGRLVADAAPTRALSPEVLSHVFGLDGKWVESASGPLLAARRRHPA